MPGAILLLSEWDLERHICYVIVAARKVFLTCGTDIISRLVVWNVPLRHKGRAGKTILRKCIFSRDILIFIVFRC
jgi:hypothetical protein